MISWLALAQAKWRAVLGRREKREERREMRETEREDSGEIQIRGNESNTSPQCTKREARFFINLYYTVESKSLFAHLRSLSKELRTLGLIPLVAVLTLVMSHFQTARWSFGRSFTLATV